MVNRTALLSALALGAVLAGGMSPRMMARAASALPPVTITGVAEDNSSATITFAPVPGASDYRVYDAGAPKTVKYAGMIHLRAGYGAHFVMQPDGVTPVYPYTATADWRGGTGPQLLHVPATQIQWNLLDDHKPHTLVVQAVDQLGPTPPANLYDGLDNPLQQPAGMLGANEGPTPDGYMSINGQGPPTNTPHVIAQSGPFVVQANASLLALPSKSDATQTFFDTFDTAEGTSLQPVGSTDGRTGVMTYTLNAGTPKAWNILYHGADTDHSMPFVDAGHFMDTLFPGVTPSAAPPGFQNLMAHTQYASMSLMPQTTADLSAGKLLHLTEEVDSHLDQTYRWLAWQIAPSTDPITNFHTDDYVTGGFQQSANTLPVNRTDKALWLQLFAQRCDATLFEGPLSGSGGAPRFNTFTPAGTSNYPACYRTTHWGDNGSGLDNRSRFDVFLTTRHLAIFEDGELLMQADIPDGGLPFSQAHVYFTHYVYATAPAGEHTNLLRFAPWETYWLNEFPYSDERHWDNMGFEVLPASEVPADWSTLATLIHLPTSTPPVASGTSRQG